MCCTLWSTLMLVCGGACMVGILAKTTGPAHSSQLWSNQIIFKTHLEASSLALHTPSCHSHTNNSCMQLCCSIVHATLQKALMENLTRGRSSASEWQSCPPWASLSETLSSVSSTTSSLSSSSASSSMNGNCKCTVKVYPVSHANKQV